MRADDYSLSLTPQCVNELHGFINEMIDVDAGSRVTHTTRLFITIVITIHTHTHTQRTKVPEYIEAMWNAVASAAEREKKNELLEFCSAVDESVCMREIILFEIGYVTFGVHRGFATIA